MVVPRGLGFPYKQGTPVGYGARKRGCPGCQGPLSSEYGTCTGVPHLQENAPPLDPTVGLCLGSWGFLILALAKARFWPWLSGSEYLKIFKVFLLRSAAVKEVGSETRSRQFLRKLAGTGFSLIHHDTYIMIQLITIKKGDIEDKSDRNDTNDKGESLMHSPSSFNIGFTVAVTPHAQKTGTSPGLIVTACPAQYTSQFKNKYFAEM